MAVSPSGVRHRLGQDVPISGLPRILPPIEKSPSAYEGLFQLPFTKKYKYVRNGYRRKGVCMSEKPVGTFAAQCAEKVRKVVDGEPQQWAYDLGISLSGLYNFLNG